MEDNLLTPEQLHPTNSGGIGEEERGSPAPLASPPGAVAPELGAEPLDPAAVAAWLSQTKPAAVLALLKDPELGLTISRAFVGLRTDAKRLANPLVRGRLTQSAVKDAKVAKKLRELAETEALTPAAPPKSAAVQIAAVPTVPKPDKDDTLRAERDQRRRERDEARQALARAETERDEAERGRLKADTERDEASKQARRQAERIGRLERQVTQLRLTETRLARALSQDKVSPPPSASARTTGPAPTKAIEKPSPWLTAVHHLLHKSKFDLALALAEDVLKLEGEDAAALDIAASALEGKRETKQAAQTVRRLLSVQITRLEIAPAAETLLRLLRLVPEPQGAEPEARRYLAALSPADGIAVDEAQRMLSRLRGIAPDAHGWLAEYITSQTPLGPILMPPPGAIGPDDPLPLKIGPGLTTTARQLTEAVDCNSAALVEVARTELASLLNADPEIHARVWAALEQAASDEPSRLLPLKRTPRGPIVADGSNVAWFDQESLVSGKPRLRHLLEMRRALRVRGFFPVVLYADANLPYFIDDPARLRTMRDRREITLVDAGTVADEVLLRMAKHLSAPLVTNDKMEDWDPDGEVPKVRYAISMGGEVNLLSDV